MRMLWARSTAAGVGLTGLLIAAAAVVAAAEALPPEVKPFAELPDLARQYQSLRSPWRLVFDSDWSGDDDHWHLHEEAHPQRVERIERDGRQVLYVEAPHRTAGLVRMGPTVQGSFAVEIVARLVSDPLCDLSLLTDRAPRGFGFQFGAYHNTRNMIWTCSDRLGPGLPGRVFSIDSPRTQRIERHRWHRVRLEVGPDYVVGVVDGQLVGWAPLGDAFDPEAFYQPTFYTHGSIAEIDRVDVYQYDPSHALDEPTAFARAFGSTTRPAFDRKIEQLVALLDAPAYAVREAAAAILEDLGELARPALTSAIKRDASPEQRHRAQSLLDLPLTLPDPEAAPAQ